MPTYDYRCKHCKATHEVSCSMKDRGNPKYCPNCKARMERQYAAIDHFWNGCEQPKGYINRDR